MEVPIVINNFNRLTTTRDLVRDLKRLGYTNIHILDNDSKYPPLLEWYDTNPCTIKRLGANLGQLAIYNSGYINEFKGWVAYTDSDIELNPETPRDFIQILIEAAEDCNKLKAGLALRLGDLPNTEYAQYAKYWEQRYWEVKLKKDIYDANVDTTFCVIQVGQPFTYDAVRVAGKFTARHIPWYLNYDNLSEEEQYIINHSNSEFSTTKRYVDSH